jgi:uncharacterized protein (TIGR02391 family)
MSKQKDQSEVLRCSFCNKDQNDVRKLIAGPTVFICDECVDVCNDIIEDDDRYEIAHARSSPPVPEEMKKFLADAAQQLHPVLAHKVPWMFERGDYHSAVSGAFKAVEAAVRVASGFGTDRYGTDLMRAAFDPHDGPLTDKENPVAEREAIMRLMSGALEIFKTSRSHRILPFDDLIEVVEAICFASHLLRIVDRAANLSRRVS